mgnify:CR=1 FL=1
MEANGRLEARKKISSSDIGKIVWTNNWSWEIVAYTERIDWSQDIKTILLKQTSHNHYNMWSGDFTSVTYETISSGFIAYSYDDFNKYRLEFENKQKREKVISLELFWFI